MIEDNIKIGTIKIQVSQFIINDNNVSRVIQKALQGEGFDIEIRPIFGEAGHWHTGEEFRVFRMVR